MGGQILKSPSGPAKESGFCLGRKEEASEEFSVLFIKLFSDVYSGKDWTMN